MPVRLTKIHTIAYFVVAVIFFFLEAVPFLFSTFVHPSGIADAAPSNDRRAKAARVKESKRQERLSWSKQPHKV